MSFNMDGLEITITDAQSILVYVPTVLMEWANADWEEQIASGRFMDTTTGTSPSNKWESALWCDTFLDALAVRNTIKATIAKSDAVICTDNAEGSSFVVLASAKGLLK